MKIKFLIAALILLISAKAGRCQFNSDAIRTLHVIDAKDSDTTGFFVTTSNDTVFLSGNATVYNKGLTYVEVKNREKKKDSEKYSDMKTRKIKFMFYGTSFWLSLPSGGSYMLMQINAISNKYILATDRTNMVFVYDLGFKAKETKMWVWDVISYPQWGKSNAKVLAKLSPYFSECSNIWDKLNFNLTYNRYLIDDLNYMRCNDAAPNIKELIQSLPVRD